MSSTAPKGEEWRERILANPATILDDSDVMNALIAANEARRGANVVDLRSAAMARLEMRLERLEATHRTVIAAAHDNIAGMGQVHRAVLALMEARDLPEFLACLGGEAAQTLRIDAVVLVLEQAPEEPGPEGVAAHPVLRLADPGSVARLLAPRSERAITLRQTAPEGAALYGARAGRIASEALLRLDFGPARLPGLLALGSADAEQFAPSQGTDLLAFYCGVVERAVRRLTS